jgi:hypothetical protein
MSEQKHIPGPYPRRCSYLTGTYLQLDLVTASEVCGFLERQGKHRYPSSDYLEHMSPYVVVLAKLMASVAEQDRLWPDAALRPHRSSYDGGRSAYSAKPTPC